MGTKARVGRKRLLLFTAVALCSLALGRGAVYTSEPEVRVAENKPAKLLCSYSGFGSPRVEWKFAQGDTTSLVCYNNKITASYEDRVTFSNTGITFHSVTRGDTGMYTCMVSDEGGNTYGEVSVQLIVLVSSLSGMKKGTANKKVIYSQPAARSEGEFRQTSSFLV
ncbi:junctional adhesion molecule A [Pteropus medius]|uniref:junctional adhesion molecule A n=1 Tax=Pteropus vampyrus TaxID=132908 RepID=UPI00196B74A2|nr:junctional adhesion molecule A [Pteropus giganteus]